MSKIKNEKLEASVLAFEKKLVPSDGYMYGTVWNKRKEASEPLSIKTKSVRGVIANRVKDPTKLEASIENANLQTVDTCALGEEQDTLKLHFTFKILSGIEMPSACNSQAFLRKYQERVAQYVSEHKFSELAKRYATNIANGRFLWRNRVGAEQIEVEVKALNEELKDKTWLFNSMKFNIWDFNNDQSNLRELADRIAEVLRGDKEFLMLEVTAYAQVGKAQDVYPSEELVLDQDDKNKNKKGAKSKILYDVEGIAAMHSQKIGNALRTIDTWYDQFMETGQPIAIEPYGTVTTLGVAYRKPKENKNDFYSLLDKKWVTDAEMTQEEQHYVMAILVRGGVFGKSGKNDSENKKKAEDGGEG